MLLCTSVQVYGAQFEGGMGYRIDQTKGIATGNDPETLYMVTSGQYYNGGCCFDYGNAVSLTEDITRDSDRHPVFHTPTYVCSLDDAALQETDNHDDGAGTMEAVYWGNCNVW